MKIERWMLEAALMGYEAKAEEIRKKLKKPEVGRARIKAASISTTSPKPRKLSKKAAMGQKRRWAKYREQQRELAAA